MPTPSWLNPALALQVGTLVAGMAVSYGVMSNKLDVNQQQNAEFRSEVMAELKEIRTRNESSSVTRAQLEALRERVSSLERFQSDQIAYNLKMITSLSRLEK